MKKRFIELTLIVVMIISFALPALGESTFSYPLHQGVGPFDWENYKEGIDFGINTKKGEDKFVPGYDLGTEGTVLWHFVSPGKLGGYANITFLDEKNNKIIFENVKSYKNNQHFAVVTYQSWRLLEAEYFPAKAAGKEGGKFNLSHTAGKEQLAGGLEIVVDVEKEHEEVTLQKIYKRDVKEFYQRDVQDFYNRTIQDFYIRTAQDIYQRNILSRYVPLFEKKVSSMGNDTLTSLLGNNDGGKFGNGMVFLKIHVLEAREQGYSFGIADSSKDNKYVGYDYNIRIEEDNLILSFDDRFIGVGAITAKVYNDAPTKHDNSGHKQLNAGGELSVPLPSGYEDTIYIYVHMNGGLNWYTTGQYEFVEWIYKDTITEDYKLINTIYGNYELLETKTSGYILYKTVVGEYNLVNTVKGDYNLVETKEISRITIQDNYNVDFDLIVEDANGDEVYSASIRNKDNVVIPNLLPGDYTITLKGGNIGEKRFYKTVLASNTTVVNLTAPTVIGDTVYIYLDNIYENNKLESDYSDNKLEYIYEDVILDDVKSDNKLDNLYLPDISTDEYLGNETDPYDLNAIRLN